MEDKTKKFMETGNSESIAQLMSKNFDVWNSDKDVYDIVEQEQLHFNLIYAISRQGKSVFMRTLVDYYLDQTNTVIFIIKQTLEPEDKDIYRLDKHGRLVFRKFDIKTYDAIHSIIDEKERNLKQYFIGREQMNDARIVLMFDDIQGVDSTMTRKLNIILNELAKQGRHYNICTYVGVQSYKQIHKNVRSQASLFLTFYPIDLEYRETIYKEFFRVGNFLDFCQIKLPRYTILGVIKSEDKKIILFRD